MEGEYLYIHLESLLYMISEIRKKLNDSELGKRINGSDIGKAFEQSPFALTMEALIEVNGNVLRADPLMGMSTSALSLFLFPFMWAYVSNYKRRDPTGFSGYASNHLDRIEPTYRTA